MPIQRLVNPSLQKPRCRLPEEAGNVPDGHALGELGLGVPRSKEENDDGREAGFEQADHEAEGVHVIAALGRGLSEAVESRENVSIFGAKTSLVRGACDKERTKTYVKAVHPSSQKTIQ